eukprot:1803864-Amphidinium_carterae.1
MGCDFYICTYIGSSWACEAVGTAISSERTTMAAETKGHANCSWNRARVNPHVTVLSPGKEKKPSSCV